MPESDARSVRAYSSVVRASGHVIERSWVRVPAEAAENLLLHGQRPVPTLISVSVPPRSTRKILCVLCVRGGQAAAKHAKHPMCGAWLYGVHRTRRDGSSFTWH